MAMGQAGIVRGILQTREKYVDFNGDLTAKTHAEALMGGF